MRRPTRAALRRRVATAALGSALLLTPTAAHATSGGGAAVTAPATTSGATATTSGAATPATVLTQPVTLTRTQLRSVQRRLRLRPDGVLGSKTRAAIKRFQRGKRLTATGTPNVETLRALGLKIADRYEARLTADASASSAPADPTAPLPASDARVATAIEAAQSRIGDPYVSGGTKPGGFDCSGLTLWAFTQAGITLPRTSFQQYREGIAVPKAQIQAGDLVFFDSAGAGASHVGIATGPATVISATSHGVMEHRIDTGYWASRYVGTRRITA